MIRVAVRQRSARVEAAGRVLPRGWASGEEVASGLSGEQVPGVSRPQFDIIAGRPWISNVECTNFPPKGHRCSTGVPVGLFRYIRAKGYRECE